MKAFSKFEVSFRIKHPDIDPSEISGALHLEPHTMHHARMPRMTPKGTTVAGVYNYSYWSHDLLVTVGSSLPQVLQDFNQQLTASAPFLKRLVSTGGQLEYFIGLFVDSNSGESLDWRLLKECADLQITLAFDVYPPSS